MLIKNVYFVNPATKEEGKTDILIQNGKISKIAENINVPTDNVIDGEGLVATPGLIDTHVHFRDPGFTYKEDIHTGALASARGGFTTVICMANTKPTVDNVETLTENLRKAKDEKIRIYQATAVSMGLKGEIISDMDALIAAGSCGFTDDGIPLKNAAFCYKAMVECAKRDVPISLHEEDPAFIVNNGINHGEISDKLGIYGSPSLAEESMVARDALLALRSGADVVIQHASSGKSVEICRMYNQLGAKLHMEVTPHHFTLNHSAVLKHGTLAKMNPPLRTEDDRLALIAGMKDGTIDLIATDHAPHSMEEKSKPLTEAPSGITGIETSLSLGITSLVRPGHLTMMELLEKMTINPAKLYHLPYGDISVGKDADLVLFNPDETWVVGDFCSKSCNTPFTGEELYGVVKYTIVGGEIVYEK